MPFINAFMFYYSLLIVYVVGPMPTVHETDILKNPVNTDPVPHLYLANMDFVVPWDRGTNAELAKSRKNNRKDIPGDTSD